MDEEVRGSPIEEQDKHMTAKGKFRIGNWIVGPDTPTYIIAEIGINHNGDPKIAKSLIDVAAEAPLRQAQGGALRPIHRRRDVGHILVPYVIIDSTLRWANH